MSNQPSNPQQVLQVKYDDLTARYANHVLVSVGADSLLTGSTSTSSRSEPSVR